MKIKSLRNVFAGIGALACTLSLSPAKAATAGDVSASLKVSNQWQSGYCAEVSIKNNGTHAVTSWLVTLDLDGTTINNLWNGQQSGNTVAGMSYNSNISAGGSQGFGFCASANDSAISPLVSELTVTLDAVQPTPSPTSSPTPEPAVTATATPVPTSTPTPSSTFTATPVPTSTPTPVATPSPTATTPPDIAQGCDGYATRFWDCCKAHCGWQANVPSGVNALKSCSSSNSVLSSLDAQSSCGGGDAHTCYGLKPYAVSDTLAYGYAATSSGDVCGRCFQLQFTGESYNAPGDPGSAALAGKTMIVQAINIGYDVSGGQFDIMVPGGGVGAFNACSDQWGVSNDELGAQYGGFLTACKQELGYNASHDAYKTCVVQRCDSVFGERGLTELQQACTWYADWFEAADNPALKYKEVACPAALVGGSGMDRGFLDDIDTSCGI